MRTTPPLTARNSSRTAALLTLVGVALGAVYYVALVAVPFPPDWLRLAPAVWLVAAIAGLAQALRALKAARERPVAIAILLASLGSTALATLLLVGALLGD